MRFMSYTKSYKPNVKFSNGPIGLDDSYLKIIRSSRWSEDLYEVLWYSSAAINTDIPSHKQRYYIKYYSILRYILSMACMLLRTRSSMSTEVEREMADTTPHIFLASSESLIRPHPNRVPARPSCFELRKKTFFKFLYAVLMIIVALISSVLVRIERM